MAPINVVSIGSYPAAPGQHRGAQPMDGRTSTAYLLACVGVYCKRQRIPCFTKRHPGVPSSKYDRESLRGLSLHTSDSRAQISIGPPLSSPESDLPFTPAAANLPMHNTWDTSRNRARLSRLPRLRGRWSILHKVTKITSRTRYR